MLADGDTDYPFNTFMVLKSSGENSLSFYASGSQRIFLIELNKNLTAYKHNKDYAACYEDNDNISAGNNTSQKRFYFVPAVVYHVITNEGNEALSYASAYDETDVAISETFRSPLLNLTDFTYYSEQPVWDGTTLTVNEGKSVAAGTLLTNTAKNGIGDIYVRYVYNRDNSPLTFPDGVDKTDKSGLDLSGNTWYTMASASGYSSSAAMTANYSRVIYVNSGSNEIYFCKNGIDVSNGKMKNPDRSLSDKTALWKLEGNDPYAIKIRNASKGMNYYLTGVK